MATRAAYPQQVVADGDFTTRTAVQGAAERGVDFYGSWRPAGKQTMAHGITAAYGPPAFRLDETANQLICPQGKPLQFRRVQMEANGLQSSHYAAAREDCLACPARSHCPPQNTMEKNGRAVSLRREPPAVEAFHAKMASESGKAIYKQRAPVAEFPHAWLKDKLKWTRLRCRGLAKAQTEALWVTLTYNLQRYFKLSQPQTA